MINIASRGKWSCPRDATPSLPCSTSLTVARLLGEGFVLKAGFSQPPGTFWNRTFWWFIDWLIDWLINWMNEWMNEWIIDWLTDWLSVCLSEWMNEWMNEPFPRPLVFLGLELWGFRPWFWHFKNTTGKKKRRNEGRKEGRREGGREEGRKEERMGEEREF